MNKKRRPLSELEGVCLGIIRRRKSCTAYRVRLELKEAPSSHWRASAGSVYPLLARLQKDELIKATADSQDGRGKQMLAISRKGIIALKQWIKAGNKSDLVSSVTDPLRSRTFFLDVLTESQRLDYLDDLIGHMESYLAETKLRMEKTDQEVDQFDYLGSLGAFRLTEARLDWLHTVRDSIGRGTRNFAT